MDKHFKISLILSAPGVLKLGCSSR